MPSQSESILSLGTRPAFAFQQPAQIGHLAGMLKAIAQDADQSHSHRGQRLELRLIQLSV